MKVASFTKFFAQAVIRAEDDDFSWENAESVSWVPGAARELLWCSVAPRKQDERSAVPAPAHPRRLSCLGARCSASLAAKFYKATLNNQTA
jgi:hypothetical protein